MELYIYAWMANLNSHWLASEDESFSLENVPNLEGKTAVVTGGSYHPVWAPNVTDLLTCIYVPQDLRALVMGVLTRC